MPNRPMVREQMWMLPPTLDELTGPDYPARFVAEFVDALDRATWAELGIDIDGDELGAPAYHPRALLSVWLHGFMTGVRSCRKLEGACRDQIPYLWLTGFQRPDHNTLWRFYKDHRQAMRKLLKHTVRTAVKLGLVDLALQAVDGTKVVANAARERTLDAQGLGRLLDRLRVEIEELEAQNEGGEEASPANLPEELADKEALREQVRQAVKELAGKDGPKHINLTDQDARMMRTRLGITLAYNAQTMVSPVKKAMGEGGGMMITAVDLVDDPVDVGQLGSMLEKTEEITGVRAETTLADAGYHSGNALSECARREQQVVMPESQERMLRRPYHKDRFTYDEESDSYTCPQGQRLSFSYTKQARGHLVRVYRARGAVCRECPAFGVCTKDGRHGRGVTVSSNETALRKHRVWMTTREATGLYALRQGLVEPVFGIIKEEQRGRRFLLRGKANVTAEWTLLATAFNLRILWRKWREWAADTGRRGWACAAV